MEGFTSVFTEIIETFFSDVLEVVFGLVGELIAMLAEAFASMGGLFDA